MLSFLSFVQVLKHNFSKPLFLAHGVPLRFRCFSLSFLWFSFIYATFSTPPFSVGCVASLAHRRATKNVEEITMMSFPTRSSVLPNRCDFRLVQCLRQFLTWLLGLPSGGGSHLGPSISQWLAEVTRASGVIPLILSRYYFFDECRNRGAPHFFVRFLALLGGSDTSVLTPQKI